MRECAQTESVPHGAVIKVVNSASYSIFKPGLGIGFPVHQELVKTSLLAAAAATAAAAAAPRERAAKKKMKKYFEKMTDPTQSALHAAPAPVGRTRQSPTAIFEQISQKKRKRKEIWPRFEIKITKTDV